MIRKPTDRFKTLVHGGSKISKLFFRNIMCVRRPQRLRSKGLIQIRAEIIWNQMRSPKSYWTDISRKMRIKVDTTSSRIREANSLTLVNVPQDLYPVQEIHRTEVISKVPFSKMTISSLRSFLTPPEV